MNDLPALLDELGVERTGVVHVGAHRGQEVPIYEAAGFERVVLVEPEPRLAQRLRDKFPTCEVVEAVCAARAAPRRKFFVPNYRTWGSLIEPPPDQSKVPGRTIEVVDTINVKAVTLASIQEGCNVAVVDAQGSEPDVLAGADLDGLDLVVVETVEPSDVFRPAWPRDEADAWFAERGWEPIAEFAHAAPDVKDVAYAPAPTDSEDTADQVDEAA